MSSDLLSISQSVLTAGRSVKVESSTLRVHSLAGSSLASDVGFGRSVMVELRCARRRQDNQREECGGEHLQRAWEAEERGGVENVNDAGWEGAGRKRSQGERLRPQAETPDLDESR